MKSDDRATKVSVVLVTYMRPTGQVGSMYIDPTWVSAVGMLASDKCSVLIGDQWLDVTMSAEDFLTAIGIAIP